MSFAMSTEHHLIDAGIISEGQVQRASQKNDPNLLFHHYPTTKIYGHIRYTAEKAKLFFISKVSLPTMPKSINEITPPLNRKIFPGCGSA